MNIKNLLALVVILGMGLSAGYALGRRSVKPPATVALIECSRSETISTVREPIMWPDSLGGNGLLGQCSMDGVHWFKSRADGTCHSEDAPK